MKIYSFEIQNLPTEIPIFPLKSVLLLPNGRLPLNLFENRYLHMFDHALKNKRIIGMIQPLEKQPENTENPVLHKIGCAGYLIAFNQTNDNRYEIVLKGLKKFKILNEQKSDGGFRIAKITWIENNKSKSTVQSRGEFEQKLKDYLKKLNIQADWEAIEASNDEDLINSIAMGCPFTNIEKQAILEADDLQKRLEVLISLIEMNLNENKNIQSTSLS